MCYNKKGNFNLLSRIVLATAVVSPLVYASDSLEGRISACRSVDDSARRLACFDSIELQSATKSAAPTVVISHEEIAGPASASVTAAAAAPVAKPAAVPSAGPKDGSFGSETVQVKTSDQIKNLTAKAVGQFNGIGKGQKIRLDNGQVWLNVDDHSYDYEATAPDVSISRNFAGNYWMKLSDSSFQFRVRRIQ